MKTKRTDRLRGRPRMNSPAISQEKTWYVALFGVRQLSIDEFVLMSRWSWSWIFGFPHSFKSSPLRNRFLLSLWQVQLSLSETRLWSCDQPRPSMTIHADETWAIIVMFTDQWAAEKTSGRRQRERLSTVLQRGRVYMRRWGLQIGQG